MVLRPRGRGRVGRRRHLVERARMLSAYGPVRVLLPHRLDHAAMSRAGIVTVVGKPNAGKSTLLNRIVGEKLAIVSEKPQSTRDRVVGIRTAGDVQMIVLDTPGLLNPRYELHRAMRSTALRALQDADVVLYLADATERTPPSLLEAAELDVLPRAPVWTVLNKVDAIRPVERDELREALPDARFVSALTGEGIEPLLSELGEAL